MITKSSSYPLVSNSNFKPVNDSVMEYIHIRTTLKGNQSAWITYTERIQYSITSQQSYISQFSPLLKDSEVT